MGFGGKKTWFVCLPHYLLVASFWANHSILVSLSFLIQTGVNDTCVAFLSITMKVERFNHGEIAFLSCSFAKCCSFLSGTISRVVFLREKAAMEEDEGGGVRFLRIAAGKDFCQVVFCCCHYFGGGMTQDSGVEWQIKGENVKISRN